MLKWDSRYRLDDFQITYIHRGAPNNIRIVPAANLRLHSYVFEVDDAEIPYHRILEIAHRHTGAVIFKRTPPKTSGV